MEPEGFDDIYETDLFEEYTLIIDHRWVRVLLFCIYCAIFLLGFGGNLFILVVILRRSSMWFVTNIFILNLAFADVLLCFGTGLFQPLNVILNSWVVGGALCHIVPATRVIAVSVTTWTCMVLAIHRGLITSPFRAGIKLLPVSLVLIVLIWVVATCLALPAGVNQEVYTLIQNVETADSEICDEFWPTRTSQSAYKLSLLVLQFGLPSIVAGACYVYVVLGGRREKGPARPRSQGDYDASDEEREIKGMRRTNRMLVGVIVLYVITWLPYVIFDLIELYWAEYDDFGYDPFYPILVHLIAMCSVLYTPLLYILFAPWRRASQSVNSRPVSNTHSTAGDVV